MKFLQENKVFQRPCRSVLLPLQGKSTADILKAKLEMIAPDLRLQYMLAPICRNVSEDFVV